MKEVKFINNMPLCDTTARESIEKVSKNVSKNAEEVSKLSEDIDDLQDSLTVTVLGKNKLYLKDQTVTNNGITVTVNDQNITVSGGISDTGSHVIIDLEFVGLSVLNGEFTLATFNFSIDPMLTNGVVFHRIIDSNGNNVMNINLRASLTETVDNLSNYKYRLVFVGATYTNIGTWSFNTQLNEGGEKEYEKAYFKIVPNNQTQLDELEHDYHNLVGNQENPTTTKLSDSGFTRCFDKVFFIGDSLTEGIYDRTNDTQLDRERMQTYFSYPAYFKKLTNCEVVNEGLAGATATNNEDAVLNYHGWITMKNAKVESNLASAYVIYLGTNDISYYGSFDGDAQSKNVITNSYGGYCAIIDKIKEVQPKAKIFCVTLPKDRNNELTRNVANTKIKEIVNSYTDCYLIDLEEYWQNDIELSEWISIYKNGGHLNALGYMEFATAIFNYINWIIKNNVSEFKQIQFIGTDNEYV